MAEGEGRPAAAARRGDVAEEVGQGLRVQVLFFARFRELAGSSRMVVTLPDGSTVEDLLAALRGRPELRSLPGRPAVAVNLEYATVDRRLFEGDEVALIPPVAGGSDLRTWITDARLEPAELLTSLGSSADGAVVLFIGRVRERNEGRVVERLEYEAYREMAERELAAIARDAAEAHGVGALTAVHRVGTLAPGEPSVAIAVAAPHRKEAYAASRAVMESIKARLPVWKRERYADGEEAWVGGAVRLATGTGVGEEPRQ